jgi:hypothetical protein
VAGAGLAGGAADRGQHHVRAQASATRPARYRTHFNPVVYTLDLLLPLVNLGQKNAFNPAGAEQWLSYALIASGWVLVTTVAAAAARVLRRG